MEEVEKGYFKLSKVEGDQSASREYDVPEQPDADDFPNRGVRVGDARVMPNRTSFMPNMSRVYTTAGDSVVALDPFLRGDKGRAGRVGGEDRGYSPADPNLGKGGGSYVYLEPGMPSGPSRPNYRASEESGIADAASFKAAQPGDIGGTPVSDYVVKAADTVKKGTFASVLSDRSNHSGFGEPR
jgi:hypothetical protein